LIRIILVEADPTSAQDIQSRLQHVSYDVVATTATVSDVIERANDLQPDIILMDIRMKGERDNIEAAREIKKRHNVPIIFIAPDTDIGTVRKAIAAEPDGFLIEPLDEHELFAAIEVAIHKHQKEQDALASERRIRELTDALPEVVYETDARGAFAFVNAMCLHMFGYTKEELQAGMTVFDVLVPEDRDRGRSVFRQRMNAQQLGWVEYTGLRKDGSTFSISLRAVPIRKDGAPVGVRGIIVDSTARKQAEKALKTAHNGLEQRVHARTYELDATNKELFSTNERLRAALLYARSLIEASLDPLVTINAQGTITDVNKATEDVTGRSRNDLIGSDFSDYFTEPAKADAGYKLVFTDGFVRDYPLALRHTSGRITEVLYNATLFRNETGEIQGVFAAARDVTERKRAEDELQRYSEHLEELVQERTSQLKDAERMAGIGETAAMIGHDLRNPLQGLRYMIDLEKMREERITADKRGVDDWEKVAELFDKIGDAIFYMDKIVGDLQDYARPLRPEREAVAVSVLISDVLHSLPHAEDVKIVTELSDFTVNADPHLLHRVFANLILNAQQAMPKGGTLTVSASTADGSIAVSVHDTGVGIPADMRDKLFSPLTTGKAKGTGLGLAVAKRIVEAHSGTIAFESKEGKGTTFTVTLPQTAD
jgi:PAS domain S-box-containing protein